eukprot:GHVH01004824.1.p1 GENE.GHVH01004824.1~~GHVH01004824.1.p1  ORF type:complete len:1151 (+),score=211.27 GHVH01004824.1:99-3551(+)
MPCGWVNGLLITYLLFEHGSAGRPMRGLRRGEQSDASSSLSSSASASSDDEDDSDSDEMSDRQPLPLVPPLNHRKIEGWGDFSDNIGVKQNSLDAFVCRCFCSTRAFDIDGEIGTAKLDAAESRFIFDPISFPTLRSKPELLEEWLSVYDHHNVFKVKEAATAKLKVLEYSSGTLVEMPSIMTQAERLDFLEIAASKTKGVSFASLDASEKRMLEASLALNDQRMFSSKPELWRVRDRSSTPSDRIKVVYDAVCRHQCSNGVLRLHPQEWRRFAHLELGFLKFYDDPFHEKSFIGPERPLLGLVPDRRVHFDGNVNDMKWFYDQRDQYRSLVEQILAYDLESGKVDWSRLMHHNESSGPRTCKELLLDHNKSIPEAVPKTSWSRLALDGIFKDPLDLFPPSEVPKLKRILYPKAASKTQLKAKRFMEQMRRKGKLGTETLLALEKIPQPHVRITGDRHIHPDQYAPHDERTISFDPTISRVRQQLARSSPSPIKPEDRWPTQSLWLYTIHTRLNHTSRILANFLFSQYRKVPSDDLKSILDPVESFPITPSFQLEALLVPSSTMQGLEVKKMTLGDNSSRALFGLKLQGDEWETVHNSVQRWAVQTAENMVKREDTQMVLKRLKAASKRRMASYQDQRSKVIGVDVLVQSRTLQGNGTTVIVDASGSTTVKPFEPVLTDSKTRRGQMHLTDGYRYVSLMGVKSRLTEVGEPGGSWREYYSLDPKAGSWSPKTNLEDEDEDDEDDDDEDDEDNDDDDDDEDDDEDEGVDEGVDDSLLKDLSGEDEVELQDDTLDEDGGAAGSDDGSGSYDYDSTLDELSKAAKADGTKRKLFALHPRQDMSVPDASTSYSRATLKAGNASVQDTEEVEVASELHGDPLSTFRSSVGSVIGSEFFNEDKAPPARRKRSSYLLSVRLVYQSHLSAGCWLDDKSFNSDAQLFLLGQPLWVEIATVAGDKVIVHPLPVLETQAGRVTHQLNDFEVILHIDRDRQEGFRGVLASSVELEKLQQYDDIAETLEALYYIKSQPDRVVPRPRESNLDTSTCDLNSVIENQLPGKLLLSNEDSTNALPYMTELARTRTESMLARCFGRTLPGSVVHRGVPKHKPVQSQALKCTFDTSSSSYQYVIDNSIQIDLDHLTSGYFKKIGVKSKH